MKTIKWLKIKWPLPLTDVARILLENQYSSTTGKGFILHATGKNKIEGRYIEKISEISVITDPFGNTSELNTTTYYTCIFSFNNLSELIELESPPRSIKKFSSKLHSLFGLGFILSEIKVDPLDWLDEIEESLNPVTVRHISASGITVPKNALAKISVSGKKDIRAEFASLVSKKSKKIDLVKFSNTIKNCNISAELSFSGSIKIGGQVYDGFKNDMRICLENSIKKSKF